MDKGPDKIIATGILIGVLLATLLGGLALVLHSLRNTRLSLLLDLKKEGGESTDSDH